MKYIVGNWKMNGTLSSAQHFAATLSQKLQEDASLLTTRKVVLCPSFPYLIPLLERSGGLFEVGGQDCHPHSQGPHTGDVSAAMLADVGCHYVLVGHSERRQHHQEINDIIKEKAAAALRANLRPIICVGETLVQRDAQEALTIVERQLIESIPTTDVNSAGILVAYEPVWAIGSQVTPTPEQVQEMHHYIRTTLKSHVPGGDTIPLLYGGSVIPENAGAFLNLPDVAGVLVGGASLRVDDFFRIIQTSQ